MRKGIILYQSKYGATKKYAQWLQEKTGFDLMETKSANMKQVSAYDTIILGGGVYASGIAGLSFLKKNMDNLAGKRILVFCTGASPYDETAIEQIKKLHFKDGLRNVPLVYCRGAWDEDIMTFKDRTLCKMLQKAVSKKDPSTYEVWERALMCAVGQKCDWTDPKYLEPIIQFLQEDSKS